MTDKQQKQQISVPVAKLYPRYTRESDPNKMSDSEFAALKALMKTDGSLETILITEKPGSKGAYLIINGHHRYWAAQELGMPELPAMLISANKARTILLGIGMNRIRGDLDLSLAGSEIQTVMDSSKLSLEQIAVPTGLSVEEIEALTQQAGEGADDLLEELGEDMAGSADDMEGENANLKPYVIEIPFSDKETYKMARRKLKKAAGKGGDLARGLLALLGEEDAAE